MKKRQLQQERVGILHRKVKGVKINVVDRQKKVYLILSIACLVGMILFALGVYLSVHYYDDMLPPM